MRRRSRSKYIHGHGYVRVFHRASSCDSIQGDGIGDIFSSIFKAGSQLLTKVPSKLVDASKTALLNVGSSTIKAVGSKLGDTIANKIVSKNVKPTPVSDQEKRRQILKELTFEKPIEAVDSKEPTQVTEVNSQDLHKQGTGIKRGRVLIGSGIKEL